MEAIRPHSSNGSSRSPPLRSERCSSSYGSGGGGTKALRVSACTRSARATRRTTAARAGAQRARTSPEPKLERQRGGDHRGPPRRQEEALQLPHLPQGRQHRRERAEEPLEKRMLVVEADRAAEAQEEEDERGERGRARREAEAGLAGRGLRPQGQAHPPGRERGPQEGPGRESRSATRPGQRGEGHRAHQPGEEQGEQASRGAMRGGEGRGVARAPSGPHRVGERERGQATHEEDEPGARVDAVPGGGRPQPPPGQTVLGRARERVREHGRVPALLGGVGRPSSRRPRPRGPRRTASG